MSFDFTRAALKHSTWKLRLRGFLDGKGGLSPVEATSHKDCDLGKWLYAEGLTKHGSFPEMKTLEREHELLHLTVKTIVDLKAAGKAREAESAFLRIEPISKRVTELLTILDGKMKT
jgi:methyl-accepting chemotaxis protein